MAKLYRDLSGKGECRNRDKAGVEEFPGVNLVYHFLPVSNSEHQGHDTASSQIQ